MKRRTADSKPMRRPAALLALGLLLGSLSPLSHTPLVAQSKQTSLQQTLSGHIFDAESKETIIASAVFAPETGQGVYTNSYGFFSLTPSKPIRTLRITCIGYEPLTLTLPEDLSKPLTIYLKPNNTLEELVVSGERKQLYTPQTGVISVPIQVIKNTPTLLGENDLMKAVQLLPGVQGGSDGSAGVHVRGGGVDENLVLLDGVSLYNVDHLFGFFSVFTPEAVKKVDLYKGNFPARFGGRLSSVIDVRTNDGHLQKYKGALSIGLLSSKLQFEGPIIKDRTSFNLSLRRTYIDMLIKPLLPEDEQGGYYFYDANLKLQHRFSDRDRLYLSLYQGKDDLYSDANETFNRYSYEHTSNTDPEKRSINLNIETGIRWGNTLGALRWNHIFSPKLYSDLVVSYTRYHFLFDNRSKETERAREVSYNALYYRSGIEDISLGWEAHYYASPRVDLRFGAGYTHHTFRPESFGLESRGEDAIKKLDEPLAGNRQTIKAHEGSLYAEGLLKPVNGLELNLGLRASLFSVDTKTYIDLQPRLSASYRLTPNLLATLGYSRMAQHVHLLSSAAMTLPTDLWVPATKTFKPMTSDQVTLGLNYNIAGGWSINLDAYHKSMNGVLEYKDGAGFIGSSEGWEQKVASGLGRSYGVELMLMRQVGRTTGWVGYTLSKSERRFPDRAINDGQWFPHKYDRRHKLNIVVAHKVNRRMDVSASWEFYTGGVISLGYERMDTMPPALNPYNDTPVSDLHGNSIDPIRWRRSVGYIPHRNNYRLPATHRLNVSLNYNRFHKSGARSIWNFSIFNVYNAMNPSFVIPRDLVTQDDSVRPNRITKFTILPIIPSISYTYKF